MIKIKKKKGEMTKKEKELRNLLGNEAVVHCRCCRFHGIFQFSSWKARKKGRKNAPVVIRTCSEIKWGKGVKLSEEKRP